MPLSGTGVGFQTKKLTAIYPYAGHSNYQQKTITGKQPYRTVLLKNRSWPKQNRLRCVLEKDAIGLRLNQANYGYNIWKADPWSLEGDPGLSHLPIFDTECKTKYKQDGFYDFFHVAPDMNCNKDFTAASITTFKDYMKQRDGSHMRASDSSTSFEAG